MVSKILNNIAHQKPSTTILSINLSEIIIINAFITSRNNPRVTIVIGKVKKTSMGFTIAFKTAKIIAKTMAEEKLFIWTPDKTFVKPKATNAVINIRIIKFKFKIIRV